MRTERGLVFALIAMAAPVSALEALAQDPPGKKPAESTVTGSDETDPAAESESDAAKPVDDTAKRPSAEVEMIGMDANVGVRVWKRTREFQRLHKSILERVKLTDKQKKQITEKFEWIYQAMRDDISLAARKGKVLPILSDAERARYESELVEAEAAGNEELAGAIRHRIAQGTPGTEENLGEPIDQVVVEMADFLRSEQLGDFHATIERWRALELRGPYDGPVRMVVRATRDPDLKLTPDQSEKIHAAMKQILADFRPAPGREALKTKTAEKLSSAIVDVMDDRQRRLFEGTIVEFETRDAELQAYAAKHLRKQNRASGAP